MRRIAWIALLCCWSCGAWAADPWCGARGKSGYTFEWVAQDAAEAAEAAVGSIRIRNASGTPVQVLDKVRNHYQDSASLRTREDFNNDGCPDLVVTSDMAAIGNESVEAFLYDRKTKRFVRSDALSQVPGPNVDPQDRNCVTGGWKGGAEDVYSVRHCWKKGKLVLVSEYDISPRYDKQARFQCYLHTETSYRKGKKHTRTKCTKTFD